MTSINWSMDIARTFWKDRVSLFLISPRPAMPKVILFHQPLGDTVCLHCNTWLCTIHLFPAFQITSSPDLKCPFGTLAVEVDASAQWSLTVVTVVLPWVEVAGLFVRVLIIYSFILFYFNRIAPSVVKILLNKSECNYRLKRKICSMRLYCFARGRVLSSFLLLFLVFSFLHIKDSIRLIILLDVSWSSGYVISRFAYNVKCESVHCPVRHLLIH